MAQLNSISMQIKLVDARTLVVSTSDTEIKKITAVAPAKTTTKVVAGSFQKGPSLTVTVVT